MFWSSFHQTFNLIMRMPNLYIYRLNNYSKNLVIVSIWVSFLSIDCIKVLPKSNWNVTLTVLLLYCCQPSAIRTEGADEATGEKAWGEFRKKNNSVVLDLFYGQLKSTVTCNYCHKQSILFEPFSNLSVPLPQDTAHDRCTIEVSLCLLYLGR